MSNFASILGKHLPALASNMLLGATSGGAQDGFMSVEDVAGLVPPPDLSGKADIDHNHDSVYAPLIHDHAEFLTQAEIEALPGFGGGSGVIGYCFVRDRKGVNVNGGSFISGAYRTRDLTEIVVDTIGCSLSLNQLTVPAGTFLVFFTVPAYDVDYHASLLWDCTADSLLVEGKGSASYSWPSAHVVSHSFIVGCITLESTSTLEVRHQCYSSKADEGFGVKNPYGDSIFTTGLLLEV
jgi:hypothetical protein